MSVEHSVSDEVTIEQTPEPGRRGRRATVAIAATMLVAAAGGVGFGIGRSVVDDTVATEPVDDAPSATSPAADEPAVAAPAPSAARDMAAMEERPAEEPADDGGAYGDMSNSYWIPTPMETIYERTTDSGIRIRLQGGQIWDSSWSEGAWTSAAYCSTSREARITFDAVDLVDAGGAGLYVELYNGVQAQVGEVGWADDRPVRYLVVQTDAATEVAVTWGDGLVDRVVTVDGLAVLVVEPDASSGDIWSLPYRLELVEPSGVRTLTNADLEYWNLPDYQAGCTPPLPGLPEPGDQPADPAAAEQALRDRFALLWNQIVPREDKRSLLDDWTGVDAAADAVMNGDFAAEAETAGHEIDEIVFTSPTTAWFRYTLYTDISDFAGRYGTATLVDGEWQFARDVMCQDLALGGGICEPGYDPVHPPSWYERYGETEMPAMEPDATIAP